MSKQNQKILELEKKISKLKSAVAELEELNEIGKAVEGAMSIEKEENKRSNLGMVRKM